MTASFVTACAAALGLACLAAAPPVIAQPAGGAVGQICKNVLGLDPGEKHFAACVDSLSTSARSLRQGQDMAAAPGEDAASRPGGARDYFTISRDTAFQRDKLACARLGFDPGQESFAGCVADLKTALARASEPAM
jgi:hypothetical protein